jgi:hypothetical protein
LSGTGNGALNRYVREDFGTTGLPGDNGVRHGFLPRAGVSLPGPPILGFREEVGASFRGSVSRTRCRQKPVCINIGHSE